MSRAWQPCGTRAAYRRHRRRGETACAECLAAEARETRDRKTPLVPHGTPAAYKRHQRRGEKPCMECTEAERRRVAGVRGHQALHLSCDRPSLPNGLPEFVPFRYRARTYAWAVRNLRRAEAEWGTPEDLEAAS